MASEKKTDFEKFLNERKGAAQDIQRFLLEFLLHCVKMENEYEFKSEEIAKVYARRAPTLIQSMCLIHSLYGYPTTRDETGVQQNAVRQMVDDLIWNENEEPVKLERYGFDREELWEFTTEDLHLESQLREPAEIFIRMVTDFFPSVEDLSKENKNNACEVGKAVLEGLSNTNYLKPAVCAETVKGPLYFGVSLGVRPFVRPVFLYKKLSQLTTTDENAVKLQDVSATQRYKDKDDETSKRYVKAKSPCLSCKIFFSGKLPEVINLLGNCAEYVVVRTGTTIGKLQEIKTTKDWSDFQKACENHFERRDELINYRRMRWTKR